MQGALHSQEMQGFKRRDEDHFATLRGHFNATSSAEMENREVHVAVKTAWIKMQLAHLATPLIFLKDPGYFWSPWRPLIQSANVESEGLRAAQNHRIIETSKPN